MFSNTSSNVNVLKLEKEKVFIYLKLYKLSENIIKIII